MGVIGGQRGRLRVLQPHELLRLPLVARVAVGCLFRECAATLGRCQRTVVGQAALEFGLRLLGALALLWNTFLHVALDRPIHRVEMAVQLVGGSVARLAVADQIR